MREIKFRVFYKDKKEMSKSFGLSVADSHVYGFPSNEEVLQFTGLLGKNGKEIYEGDIVEWHPDYDVSLGGKAIIIFEKAEFIASVEKTGGIDFYGYDGQEFQWEELEVIGNIYENPDLLV